MNRNLTANAVHTMATIAAQVVSRRTVVAVAVVRSIFSTTGALTCPRPTAGHDHSGRVRGSTAEL
jgi:hypothetical protein